LGEEEPVLAAATFAFALFEERSQTGQPFLSAAEQVVGSQGIRPWAGQRLGAQVLGKVQIWNAKAVFWEIVSADPHGTPIIQCRKAGSQRPGSESIPRAPECVDLASGMPAFTQPHSNPGRELAANNRALH